MIKQYFKQAWQLVKQHQLFSGIYIAGTALGISMVMIMAILNYVKTANLSPEINRDRTMYVQSLVLTSMDTVRFKGTNSGNLSYKAAQLFFLPLKSTESVSIMTPGRNFASLPNDDNLIRIKSRFVDTNYWNVFNFRFLAGKPFSDADYESGLQVVVIAESLAKQLFGSDDAVGRYIDYGFKPYRIAGVVKDVSYLFEDTHAQIWMPYTCRKEYDKENQERAGMLGDVSKVFLLARTAADFESIRDEVNDNVRRYNAQATEWKVDLLGQPDIRTVAVNRFWSNVGPDMKKIRIQNILIVLLLLVVPAINLSGMNSTRMERRLGEMGVRKAFGASRSKLVNQVLTENLLLTGLGGLAGLLLSYLIIFFTRNWILDIGKQFAVSLPEGTSVDFSMSMLFNVKIFIIVLLVCFLMNILSALVPVYRSLRKNITDSLYIKYN
jgi:ABC-type antimicrobial peptide transport system, permease component